jgi:ABC-type sugar transport system permease subunit
LKRKEEKYMENRKKFTIFLLLTLTASFLFPVNTMATSWVYSFVVWDGYIYEVTEESVTEIDSYIGEVTVYSDMETYPGNFSNTYKQGTNYYSIKDLSTDEAIAVEVNKGNYKEAIRREEYAGGTNEINKSGFTNIAIAVFGVVIFVLIISVFLTFVYHKDKNKD